MRQLNGFALDKTHKFKASRFAEFERSRQVPDVYEPPSQDLKAGQREDLLWWMMDPRAFDQYSIRVAEDTEVHWNSVKKLGEKPEVVIKRKNWSESRALWSPRGSFLVTLHKEGVALWGGPSFNKIQRFAHSGLILASGELVGNVEFSPCERFLITTSPLYKDEDNANDPKWTIVWDVLTGAKLRGFTFQQQQQQQPPSQPQAPVDPRAKQQQQQQQQPPLYHWSFDGKYFARLGHNSIYIYETPGMGLVGKQSLKIDGVSCFKWSPASPFLALFVPEQANVPARACILEMPGCVERRQRNLFSVGDGELIWHPSGDFLCVKVERLSKSKKPISTNLEIFRMREKDIPLEAIEVKDPVQDVSWEPQGKRFAVLHRPADAARPDVSFYEVAAKVKLLKTLKAKGVNQLCWSPQGNYIVLAGLIYSGALEFYSVNEMESLANEEHHMCNGVKWDPSGRFFVTEVGAGAQMENGFTLWSFSGKPLFKFLKDRFHGLCWRPRPPTLLTKAKEKLIRRDLKKYSTNYEKEDMKQLEHVELERKAWREREEKTFYDLYNTRLEEIKKRRATMKPLRSEDDYITVEEWVEEVVEVREEAL